MNHERPENTERMTVAASYPAFLETSRKLKMEEMWSDEKHAVQVKGSSHEAFGIYETDEVGPAPVEIAGEGNTRKLFDGQLRSFRTKVKSFGKDVKGYFIVIPSDKLDFTTGEPSKELVELVRQKIAPQKSAFSNRTLAQP